GRAQGPVFQALAQRFKTKQGKGTEDPRDYDLVIFDGNHMTGQQLHDTPATAGFLTAGKTLIILNNTEEHRSHLKGLLWAHSSGVSPGVAFVIHPTTDGGQVVSQIDFPYPYLNKQMKAIANQWIDTIQSNGSGSSILPASAAAGQTVVAFDDVL